MVCTVQRSKFHGKWQYLFIESICNDPQVLEQNYRYKWVIPALLALDVGKFQRFTRCCPLTVFYHVSE